MSNSTAERGKLGFRVSARVKPETRDRIEKLSGLITFGGRRVSEADIVRMALEFGLARLERKSPRA